MGEGEEPERLEMVAAYTPDRLRDMVRTAHSRLRSRGQLAARASRRRSRRAVAGPARAPRGRRARRARASWARPETARAVAAAIERARALRGRARAGGAGRAGRSRTSSRSCRSGSNAKALCTPACDEYRDGAGGLRGPLPRAARVPRPHDAARAARALRRPLRRGQARALRARLRGPRADRARPARGRRGAAPAVRRALRARARGRVPGHQPAAERAARSCSSDDNLFRVGDENQSIYGFRNADVEVFRAPLGRAAAAEGRAESITVNFRSRGEVLEAIDRCFEQTWGEGFEPLREADGARAHAAAGRRPASSCS